MCSFCLGFRCRVVGCGLHCLTSKLLFWWVESRRMEFWRRGKKLWWGKRTRHAKTKITTQIGSPHSRIGRRKKRRPHESSNKVRYLRQASIDIRYQRPMIQRLCMHILRERERRRGYNRDIENRRYSLIVVRKKNKKYLMFKPTLAECSSSKPDRGICP